MVYIYLDQNKWIELAKGLKKGDHEYVALYNRIIKKTEDREWSFPLSIIHLSETVKRRDDKSREDILKLMFDMSNCYAICDYHTADRLEFLSLINTGKVQYELLRNIIIQTDWLNIFGLLNGTFDICDDGDVSLGLSETVNSIIKELSKDRVMFDCVCNVINNNPPEEDYYYECYEKGRKDFIRFKDKIRSLDEYKEKHLYPFFLVKMFSDLYKGVISELSEEKRTYFMRLIEHNSKNKTMKIEFLESLPGFCVHNRLLFELFNNSDKKVHKHDFNDLAYLRVAVPYCDVVIGEKYWCDRVRYYRLDKKFNTIVDTNIFNLRNW